MHDFIFRDVRNGLFPAFLHPRIRPPIRTKEIYYFAQALELVCLQLLSGEKVVKT